MKLQNFQIVLYLEILESGDSDRNTTLQKNVLQVLVYLRSHPEIEFRANNQSPLETD
jgi:hypothetical protein